MDVSLLECPACGANVLQGDKVCNECGKELPIPEEAAPTKGFVAQPGENPCPRCGVMVPRQALRCRDCGSYMNTEIEAAAMAQQASRMFRSTGASGPFGMAGNTQEPASNLSGFAEVADDSDFESDFDYGGEIGPSGFRVKDLDEVAPTTGSQDDDDFMMDDVGGDYSVAASSIPTPPAPAPAPLPPQLVDIPVAVPTAPGPETAAIAVPTAETPAPTSTEPPKEAPPIPAVPHSVETGGDVLLDAALAEESEASRRAKMGGRRRPARTAITGLSPDRLLVFCPNGHRIQVQEKHRGRTGRCPNCKTLFFVPVASTNQTLGQAGGPAAPGADPNALPADSAPIAYSKWVADVRLHRVNPAKLKLVAGSLESDYESVDLGASPDNLLIAVLFAGSGPFRAMQEPKKKPAVRQAMLDHLAARKPIEELPVVKKHLLGADQLAQLKIVQPSIPGEESLFADIPVFGVGRIALRVAPLDAPNERAYLSFALSQFRQFSALLSEAFNLANFGGGTSIPLADEMVESTCHYSEAAFKSLVPKGLEFYQNDPAMKLVIVGRRCEKCGLTVSEDSRKKEKIGGKTDASVAKALCPKCKAKFGNIVLYGFSS